MKLKLNFYLLMWLLPAWMLAQHTVTGTVTSEGETLIGASILVRGTTTGTITDIDGSYTLEAPSSRDTLEVSYVGYTSMLIPIEGRTRIDIDLAVAAELLNEIVVVGYGVQRKDDLTGAISVVESKSISAIPTQSLGQALQGKVSGLQVTPGSGEPGADAISAFAERVLSEMLTPSLWWMA
ncbi:MAG: carboxypeptidase-like regulatory domain-containing protein [Saprospiraceae bacterium]